MSIGQTIFILDSVLKRPISRCKDWKLRYQLLWIVVAKEFHYVTVETEGNKDSLSCSSELNSFWMWESVGQKILSVTMRTFEKLSENSFIFFSMFALESYKCKSFRLENIIFGNWINNTSETFSYCLMLGKYTDTSLLQSYQ